jgi:hypothetical protein
LRGLPIDPETVTGFSGIDNTFGSFNNERTGGGSPMLRQVSVGMQITF